jgi:hypothetical protein
MPMPTTDADYLPALIISNFITTVLLSIHSLCILYSMYVLRSLEELRWFTGYVTYVVIVSFI